MATTSNIEFLTKRYKARKGARMAAVNPTSFSWDTVDAQSDLHRLRLALDYLPDQQIIEALQSHRGKGRDDFPVAALWNAVVAGVVFQHASIESLLRELRRNPSLAQACGFNMWPLQAPLEPQCECHKYSGKLQVVSHSPWELHYALPNSWNVSRFLANLISVEQEQNLVSAMITTLLEQLMEALPDFGLHLGYDGKAIDSHSTGQKKTSTGLTSDPEADWGKHQTTGINSKTGKAWQKIKSWFGYSLHLIADTQYEIPVAFEITRASHSEVVKLSEMTDKLFEQTPTLAERCQDFSADRGLDSGSVKAKLWDDHAIRPLIDTREMWREEKQEAGYDPTQVITRPLYPERVDTIIHSEKGEVFCVCPQTSEQRPLAFQGFEADRNTLKYRCPAAAYGFECAGKEACHKSGEVTPGDYGRIIRIPITQKDRRIFVPTPYNSPSWHRGYNRRSALERINNRIDNSFGFENHFIRGKSKMQARVGLALAIMMAMALGHAVEGRKEQMRSLVKPVPIAASG
jgi:hypothetical protein